MGKVYLVSEEVMKELVSGLAASDGKVDALTTENEQLKVDSEKSHKYIRVLEVRDEINGNMIKDLQKENSEQSTSIKGYISASRGWLDKINSLEKEWSAKIAKIEKEVVELEQSRDALHYSGIAKDNIIKRDTEEKAALVEINKSLADANRLLRRMYGSEKLIAESRLDHILWLKEKYSSRAGFWQKNYYECFDKLKKAKEDLKEARKG